MKKVEEGMRGKNRGEREEGGRGKEEEKSEGKESG